MSYPLAILLACLTLLCIQVHDRLARSRDERRIELTSKANAESLEATAKLAEAQHARQMEAIQAQRELNREWIEGQMKLEHPWRAE